MKVKIGRYRLWLTVFGLVLSGLLIVHFYPKTALASQYPKSTAIYAKQGELLRLTLAKDQQFRIWVSLAEIPDDVRQATLLYEDQWFYRHPGVNLPALLRSAWTTYVKGTRQGASTITMQVARQLYHIPSRRLFGKTWQVLAACWLELRYSKAEILETYLNTAPYGGNIVGVAAASLVYFHKPVAQLSLSEALMLAVIPQNPKRRNPGSMRYGHILPAALSDARQRLWARWKAKFPEASQLYQDLPEPLKVYAKSDKPFLAPHLTSGLLQRYPGESQIHTSIHLGAQITLTQLIEQYRKLHRHSGINNASALLLDTTTMNVLAMIGSADFWDTRIAGQVNGVLAKRSPGSALKPFVYALGLDQGLIHPQTILFDMPKSFGNFRPENFDGRFLGPVTAQEALIRSRNIPAISIAAQLNKPTLYGFLQQAGVSGLADEQHYGLSLALGGAELTMEELAQLYAVLNNQGRFRTLHYRTDLKGQDADELPLLSPAAAYITLDMLSNNPRPDTKRPAEPKIAWKTGTSWGFKDAWTAGLFGRYVLVVWVGNFKNQTNTAFIGIQTAAPLFFTLVDGLRSRHLLKDASTDLSAIIPEHVTQIDVCAASGDLPNPDCPKLAKIWFIPGKSPIKVSTLHRAVYFDRNTGTVVCPGTDHGRKEVFEFWNGESFKLFQQAGMPRRQPPALPDCYAQGTGVSDDGPQIVTPSVTGIYSLQLSKPSTIGLKADHGTGNEIFWYANKSYIGKSAASEVLAWRPNHPGRYLLRAVDKLGRAASRDITVEFMP